MKHWRSLKLFVFYAGTIMVLFGLCPAGASSANISNSYKSKQSINIGSLVSLDAANNGYVLPANSKSAPNVLGVAVVANDSLLAVDAANGLVQIATSGTASALVTTLNGDIKVGDQVAVSPFNGLGAKANDGDRVVGLAQSSFTARSEGAVQRTVTDNSGKDHQISVGFLRVNVGAGRANTVSHNAVQLTGSQQFVKGLTGKTVPTARIVISLVVALVAFVALVTLIYGSIYSGVISVGRNPLAKYSVIRTVLLVLLMAAAMAVLAVATIFFLLR